MIRHAHSPQPTASPKREALEGSRSQEQLSDRDTPMQNTISEQLCAEITAEIEAHWTITEIAFSGYRLSFAVIARRDRTSRAVYDAETRIGEKYREKPFHLATRLTQYSFDFFAN